MNKVEQSGKGNSGDAQVPHDLNTAIDNFRTSLERGEVDAMRFILAADKNRAGHGNFANEARWFLANRKQNSGINQRKKTI